MNKPLRVAVTGAAGQIAYSLLPRIAQGEVFGKDQAVILQLIEITPALKALEGVSMEIFDCAPSPLVDIICTDDGEKGFGDADAVFLIGGMPRGPGMLRKDLIQKNGPIFRGQGDAIGKFASRDVKVLTVANPCNTNCLVTQFHAKGIADSQFHAMTRLDQNRAVSQLAGKAGKPIASVKNVTIWGNHSATQFADASCATIDGQAAYDILDKEWLRGDFRSVVAQRGKAIIDARGKSSAASAANAAIEHMMTWVNGTADGEHTSMAITSDGSYGVPAGLICSFPVTVKDGKVSIVQGIEMDDWSKENLQKSVQELLDEREAVKKLLS
jgi:malate dehydrogenase